MNLRIRMYSAVKYSALNCTDYIVYCVYTVITVINIIHVNVQINNPPVGVVIWLRVSVVTNETPVPRPHAFQLTGSNCKNGIYYLKLFFQTPVADFDIEYVSSIFRFYL